MYCFQSEQKRFLQQHKQRSETYSKAAAAIKKQRKRNKGTTKTGLAMDKELKVSSFATAAPLAPCEFTHKNKKLHGLSPPANYIN
jgi:menaquinone-dependent protoporphyrinogen IX oxidase